MWPFSRRTKLTVGVQGQPVKVISRDLEMPGPVARHEAVIERLGLAIDKERRGRNRDGRLKELEDELFRQTALLQMTKGT